jgi:hypothetical protein
MRYYNKGCVKWENGISPSHARIFAALPNTALGIRAGQASTANGKAGQLLGPLALKTRPLSASIPELQ